MVVLGGGLFLMRKVPLSGMGEGFQGGGYHSTLGLGVIKQKKKEGDAPGDARLVGNAKMVSLRVFPVMVQGVQPTPEEHQRALGMVLL